MNHHEIIIAGFGGQGIMMAGNILAYAGMMENKSVSWYPVYGPEKRGGTAACHVIISEQPVGSPILNEATALVVMNGPSLEKFENSVKERGVIIADSSLTQRQVSRKDVCVYEIPATKMASELGNIAYANIILLGKLIAYTGMVSKDSFIEALKKVLPEKKHYLIPEEVKALEAGMEF
jgi:2-oxoglutarate ferredoxin oxidoreductase subunit gamma